jgi:hypothetical protein
MKREGKGGEGAGKQRKGGEEGKRREGIGLPTFSYLPPPMGEVRD